MRALGLGAGHDETAFLQDPDRGKVVRRYPGVKWPGLFQAESDRLTALCEWRRLPSSQCFFFFAAAFFFAGAFLAACFVAL